MISLGAIEEKISKLIELKEDSLIDFIVTSIEDEKREKKIVLLISHVENEYILELKRKNSEKF